MKGNGLGAHHYSAIDGEESSKVTSHAKHLVRSLNELVDGSNPIMWDVTCVVLSNGIPSIGP